MGYAKVTDSVLGLGQSSSKHAAFLTACSQHCGQWAQGQILSGHNDFNVTIYGWTAATAVNAWAAATFNVATPSRQLWLQNNSYPCKTCCSGGNSFAEMSLV